MDEVIDPQRVILQLQLENEQLRNYMRGFESVQHTMNALPNFLDDLYAKVVKHKYQLLIGLMIVYWIASLSLLFYDRWHKS
jgi:hypothetical protein